jgi:hypothetical protein
MDAMDDDVFHPDQPLLYERFDQHVDWHHGSDYSFGWPLLISFLCLSILTNIVSLLVARRVRARELRSGQKSSLHAIFMYLNAEGLLFNVACLVQCSLNNYWSGIFGEAAGCTGQAFYAGEASAKMNLSERGEGRRDSCVHHSPCHSWVFSPRSLLHAELLLLPRVHGGRGGPPRAAQQAVRRQGCRARARRHLRGHVRRGDPPGDLPGHVARAGALPGANTLRRQCQAWFRASALRCLFP